MAIIRGGGSDFVGGSLAGGDGSLDRVGGDGSLDRVGGDGSLAGCGGDGVDDGGLARNSV